MNLVNKLKQVELLFNYGDGMYDGFSYIYSIKKENNMLIISYIKEDGNAFEGMPENAEEIKLSFSLNDKLIRELEELLTVSLSYVQFMPPFEQPYEFLSIEIDENKYQIDINYETIKCFYNFLKRLNLPNVIDFSKVVHLYSRLKNTEVPEKQCIPKELLFDNIEDEFKFAYVNIYGDRKEITINFSYKDKWSKGFRIYSKNIYNYKEYIKEERREITLSSNEELKNEFLNFFNFYLNKKYPTTDLENDYCIISYGNETIKFSRKYLSRSFYDLLDSVYGFAILDIEIDSGQKNAISKFTSNKNSEFNQYWGRPEYFAIKKISNISQGEDEESNDLSNDICYTYGEPIDEDENNPEPYVNTKTDKCSDFYNLNFDIPLKQDEQGESDEKDNQSPQAFDDDELPF